MPTEKKDVATPANDNTVEPTPKGTKEPHFIPSIGDGVTVKAADAEEAISEAKSLNKKELSNG